MLYGLQMPCLHCSATGSPDNKKQCIHAAGIDMLCTWSGQEVRGGDHMGTVCVVIVSYVVLGVLACFSHVRAHVPAVAHKQL